MRKQDHFVIWPAYFDSSRSRSKGRRVPTSLAIPSPKATDIAKAAEKLGLTCKSDFDVSYPKYPWLKTGIILAKKSGSKNKMIRDIAQNLATS